MLVCKINSRRSTALKNKNIMRFFIIISALLFMFEHINGKKILTYYNDDCKDKVAGSLNLVLSKLNDQLEENHKTLKYLKDLNERIDNNYLQLTKEMEILKAANQKQDMAFCEINKDTLHDAMEEFYQTKIINSKEQSRNCIAGSPSKTPNIHKSWITTQRRQDGSVDFYRNWNDYKNGFGFKDGEFFLGLDEIHTLTNESPHELMIILIDFNGNLKYAHYDDFLIGNEEEKYQLKSLGEYNGTAGDNLRDHEFMYFSTKDRDNDKSKKSCAISFEGAWWFNVCMTSNLNGPYRYSPYLLDDKRGQGITWGDYDEIQYAYKFSQMMIRPKENIFV